MNAARQQAQAPTWNEIREQLRDLLGEEVFDRWFLMVIASIEDNNGIAVLYIASPNKFHSNGIQERFSSTIAMVLRRLAPDGTIIFTVQEQEKTQRESEKNLSAKVIQLPLWPEAQRGVPNDILRSALFAAIQGKEREYAKQCTIAAYEGVRIKYTGESLDQSDLDVWEQVVHLARRNPLGTECHFAAHGFLKTIGRSTGKTDHKWTL